MPSTSEKQRRAMQAAAHGKSTLGIPQSVGKEYAQADRQQAQSKALRKRTSASHNGIGHGAAVGGAGG